MKKIWKLWVARLKSETPAFWNIIKTVFGYVPIIYSVVNKASDGAVAPSWFTNSQWYVVTISGIIFFIAQSQVKKEEETK